MALSDTPPTTITDTLRSNSSVSPFLRSSSAEGSNSNSNSSDSDDDDESDDEDQKQIQQTLRSLLLKAKESARAAAAAVNSTGEDSLATQDEVVLFTSSTTSTATGSTSKDPYSLPSSLVKPLQPSSSRQTSVTLAQSLAGSIISSQDRWGQPPLPNLSKKQKQAATPRTAGPNWFNLPATEVTPEIRREIMAMKARMGLDPKRFYKGSAKDNKLPEFFAVSCFCVSFDTVCLTDSFVFCPHK